MKDVPHAITSAFRLCFRFLLHQPVCFAVDALPWSDDGYGDEEEIEEKRARPENSNQERLVAYFEGNIELSDQILGAFLSEKDADEPNYPLFRKYFRQGNGNLKRLIISGLIKNLPISDYSLIWTFTTIPNRMVLTLCTS